MKNNANPIDQPGRFVCLEGMPGAGKTTVWAALKASEQIQSLKIYFSEVLIESEEIAEQKRQNMASSAWDADAWYYGQEKYRVENARNKILAGFNVLSDRSVLSTLAFAYARGKLESNMGPYHKILQMFKETGQSLLPDAIIMLMVDVNASIERRKTASPERSIGPWENHDFLNYFHEFYLSEIQWALDPSTTRWIDTTRLNKQQEKEAVVEAIAQVCMPAPVLV